MSFPMLDSFNPSSVHPKQGWTKKRFLEVYGELQELIDFQIQKRMKAIDFLIEGFRARRAQVAALPPIFDKISYFHYIDGIQSSVEDSRDVKKRSRLEWEDAVRTRTGKRPRPAVPGTALRPTVNSIAQAQLADESKVALPSVLEDTHGAVSSVQKACAKTVNRPRVTEQAPTVSSTPVNPKVHTFVVPTTTRVTRCKQGTGTRIKRRFPKPEDTLMSARGSVILNPFSLRSDQPRLTATELQLARKLYTELHAFFDGKKI
ncbi:hypothetical protein P879_04788 [Paragonimus westermani]|uniref:Uncharacterized protein n=1 Tax=Paragonimus westermani TaxID=34504 RepID=A0A8T0DM92_9TREM|nr:hypothetical protein P879_04788 [Paragonimus westermani]